jgi:hypothetical protein
MEKALIDLTNPEFSIKLGEKEYLLRKATLRQVISFQKRVKELSESKEVGSDAKTIAFAYFLLLEDKYKGEYTEESLLDVLPGAQDSGETLVMLGFMSPQQMKLSQVIEETLKERMRGTKDSLQQ